MSDDDDVKDSNGNILKDGDSVHVIKDLKVKGAGETLKRGTLIKNIRLTGNPGEIEGRTATIKGLVLKTCFLRNFLAPHIQRDSGRLHLFPHIRSNKSAFHHLIASQCFIVLTCSCFCGGRDDGFGQP